MFLIVERFLVITGKSLARQMANEAADQPDILYSNSRTSAHGEDDSKNDHGSHQARVE